MSKRKEQIRSEIIKFFDEHPEIKYVSAYKLGMIIGNKLFGHRVQSAEIKIILRQLCNEGKLYSAVIMNKKGIPSEVFGKHKDDLPKSNDQIIVRDAKLPEYFIMLNKLFIELLKDESLFTKIIKTLNDLGYTPDRIEQLQKEAEKWV